jgi:hypothetical protein
MTDTNEHTEENGIYYENKMSKYCMRNMGLTSLPFEDISSERNLHIIDVRDNNIERIDELPPMITTLKCDNNGMTKFMPNDSTPDTLTYLSCSHNKLTSLPYDIPEGLEYLDCSHNKLTELPEVLYQCWGLVTLICDGNCLTRLPFLPDDMNLEKIRIIGDRADDPLLKVYPRLLELEREGRVEAIVRYVNKVNNNYMYDRSDPNAVVDAAPVPAPAKEDADDDYDMAPDYAVGFYNPNWLVLIGIGYILCRIFGRAA